MAKLNYVELSVESIVTVRPFYENAFGWTFTEYGPDYAAIEGGATTVGFNADTTQPTPPVLPLIEVTDLEAALASATAAGGTLRVPIFAYPGGRRFHIVDPAGHEIGVYQSEH
ncbi:VOC family protein [Sphingobium sp. BS19]|uniref:VOC family protein n=1 Tax=Sphingobium sp. BS19 TaxID=3018973 RepID=UPI0022EED33A|nr:VOC family protein [Sphingobium sp. BS19]GLI96450.1 glyoxalase [Sphingobium sp. BS19]